MKSLKTFVYLKITIISWLHIYILARSTSHMASTAFQWAWERQIMAWDCRECSFVRWNPWEVSGPVMPRLYLGSGVFERHYVILRLNCTQLFWHQHAVRDAVRSSFGSLLCYSRHWGDGLVYCEGQEGQEGHEAVTLSWVTTGATPLGFSAGKSWATSGPLEGF